MPSLLSALQTLQVQIPSLPFILLSFFFIYLTSRLYHLRRHIRLAKSTNLPYILSPLTFNSFLILLYRPILRLLSYFPSSLTHPWISVISPLSSWDNGHATYSSLSSDTFLIVTSSGITMRTCDPQVITQITQRKNDFVKPVETYKVTDIFGKNVLSVEGDVWRRHRRVVGPSFGEGVNRVVWGESLRQAEGMVGSWVCVGGQEEGEGMGWGKVESLAEDCMRLSLGVISRAGFGREMSWSEEKSAGGREVGEGHDMSFQDALAILVSSVYLVALLPRIFLRFIPLPSLRRGYQSFVEIKKYMLEFKQQAEEDPEEGGRGSSLLKAMVNAAATADGDDEEDALKQGASKQSFTQDELFGNAFIMIVAGHETTANTLQYAMINLAMHPKVQRRLQTELDEAFGSRGQSEWSYEDDLQKLLNGLPGAIMAEQLRVQSPVAGIGKLTLVDQALAVNGDNHILPKGTLIYLDTTGAHLNPEAWKDVDSNDLGSFNPDRWLKKTADSADKDSERSLYQPEAGAFIAFSAGARSCIGKRFAQIEFVAVIAGLFREWSVELDVEGQASAKELLSMTEIEKKAVWERARQDVKRTLKDKMTIYLTMQLENGLNIPLKVVRRGKEMFGDWA